MVARCAVVGGAAQVFQLANQCSILGLAMWLQDARRKLEDDFGFTSLSARPFFASHVRVRERFHRLLHLEQHYFGG
jgi:hypothetical protein